MKKQKSTALSPSLGLNVEDKSYSEKEGGQKVGDESASAM